MKNKWAWQLPFLLILLAGTFLAIKRNYVHISGHEPFQRSEGTIFGTLWHATYQSDSTMDFSITQELQRVDASLSMFNPHSNISRINRGETEQADSLLQTVVRQALEISRATDGCFDITVAPLVNAWGFGFKNGELPDSARVDSLRQLVGWQGITLEGGMLHKKRPDMVLDLSAIAKGFGVDQVASLFNRHGIRNYMIEIGGEIVVKGTNPRGEQWNIGVNRPVEDSTSTNNEVETILALTDCAMATSGNYRNYYYGPDGRKLAHTIDPLTGYPVQHSILSSTVLAPTCSMADAFATSFMVMGMDKARQVLARQPQLQAYFIYSTSDGQMKTWCTEGLKQRQKK